MSAVWYYVEERLPDTPQVSMTQFSTRALAFAYTHECAGETKVHEIEAGSEDAARVKLVARHPTRERDIRFYNGYSWSKRSGRLVGGRENRDLGTARG